MKLCWLYEKAVSRAVDADGELPAWVRRHLDKCIQCREYHQAQVCLTAALIQSAPAELTSPSSFLHARILSALDQQAGVPETQGIGLRALRSLLIPAVGVFIIGIIWLWKPGASTLRPVVDGQLVGREPLPMPAPNGVDAAALLKWNEKLNQPLESEIYYVVDDAKSALIALGDNFLPHRF